MKHRTRQDGGSKLLGGMVVGTSGNVPASFVQQELRLEDTGPGSEW